MKIKTNIKRFMMTLSLAIMTLAASAQNEAINNETILTLLKEGFSSEEIIGAIENSTERTIQYSIDYMRQLKAAGADAALTTYIQKIAKQDFGYEGILWWNPTNGGKPKKMYRTQFEKESKGFNLGTIAAMGAGCRWRVRTVAIPCSVSTSPSVTQRVSNRLQTTGIRL